MTFKCPFWPKLFDNSMVPQCLMIPVHLRGSPQSPSYWHSWPSQLIVLENREVSPEHLESVPDIHRCLMSVRDLVTLTQPQWVWESEPPLWSFNCPPVHPLYFSVHLPPVFESSWLLGDLNYAYGVVAMCFTAGDLHLPSECLCTWSVIWTQRSSDVSAAA